ncbi:putative transcriptional regulator [Oceanisphaera litoralis]|uniref:YqgE/AlgH family protein n=1 Tax=Oceanisphaera litoralis TaxID=225144 RepID=UPI00195EB3FA|nr:YqgE/AlgH family protein [Oceanisphaera litoralis]MBM7454327.1 putative transcriptional regulator [Oceanisphaera litoralis]
MDSLQHHFLIAMPSLKDPFFAGSVTYICEHNDEGAMGLVINIPIDMPLHELLHQLKMAPDDESELDKPVLQGGPVAADRGFVLHSPVEGFSSSQLLTDNLMITTSPDVLETLGTEQAPEHYLVALGYAGWTPGQLEQELTENSWLTIPADTTLIFDTPLAQRWHQAIARLGIDARHLSSQVGHA